MKNTLLALVIATASANAATYTLTNNAGPINTMSVVNKDGVYQNTGFVAIGSFLSLTKAQVDALFSTTLTTTTLGTALGNFTQLNSGSLAITSGINGVFSVATNGVDPLDNLNLTAADPWTGKNLYVLMSNAATLSAATQFLAFRFNTTVADVEPVTLTVNMRATDTTLNGSVIYGGWNNFQVDPTPSVPAVNKSAFNMAAVVPEPSAALLGAFGVLGLLRRRRN